MSQLNRKTLMKLKILFVLCLLSFPVTSLIPDQPNLENNKSPVNIISDEAEWDNNQNLFIARGNAKLTQDDKIITCEELWSYFKKK